ncbi:hypothetical protein D3C84_1186260 [compost metagenome]
MLHGFPEVLEGFVVKLRNLEGERIEHSKNYTGEHIEVWALLRFLWDVLERKIHSNRSTQITILSHGLF